MHLSHPQWVEEEEEGEVGGEGVFVSQVEMLMVLSWQVAEVTTELWEPYAKQITATLHAPPL